MQKRQAKVEWAGREEIHFELDTDAQNKIQKFSLTGVGGPDLLRLLSSYRQELESQVGVLSVFELSLPEGRSPAVLCLREAILKLKGEWNYPYKEEELCHCRAVLTAVVDQAICAGAHSSRKVSEQTSASTACGTCRPDVEAIIAYRLGKK